LDCSSGTPESTGGNVRRRAMSSPGSPSEPGPQPLSPPGGGRVRRLSLRSKVVLVTVSTGALVAGTLVWAFYFQAKEAMTEELRSRGRTAAIGLSSNLSYALSTGDMTGLAVGAQATIDQVPDVAYVVVRDKGGWALVESFRPELRLQGFSTADVPSLGPVDPAMHAVDRVVELR